MIKEKHSQLQLINNNNNSIADINFSKKATLEEKFNDDYEPVRCVMSTSTSKAKKKELIGGEEVG